MAKAKKDTKQKSDKADAVRIPDDANKETTKPVKKPKMAGEKPQKKLDKVSKTKPRSKNSPIAEMIKIALNNLKSRQGCSLIAIRNFIATTCDVKMKKPTTKLNQKLYDGRIRRWSD